MKVDDCFAPFFDRAALVRLARSYGVRDEEDVVQEALLVLHRRRAEVPLGGERAFLAGVTRRIALRAKMRAARFVPVDDLDVEDESDGVEARLVEAREHAIVRDALVRLSAEDRVTFDLFVRDGLTKNEVAAALGIPVGTAASRRARARRALEAEVQRTLAAGVTPCVAARAALFVAGREWYARHGLGARYRAALPPRLRASWEELSAASTSWVSIDTAMELYGASSALQLSDADGIDIGRHVFRAITDAVPARLHRHPTARAVVENASRLWQNAFEGGEVGVRLRGETSAELEFRAPMFKLAFFRNTILGAVTEALAGFHRLRIGVKSHTARALVLVAEGV